MLVEPPEDAERLALDRALIAAARARIAAGARGSADADAIALRELLRDIPVSERPVLRAVLGRIEAATGPALSTCGPLSQALAADRWGLIGRPTAEPDQALLTARQGGRALIDLGVRPWWGKLLALPMLKVVAALPDDAAGVPRALLVSTEAPGPTGDDRTFWVTDSPASDARIVTALGEAGLIAAPLTAGGGLKLFTLTGYVQAEDGRLIDAPGQMSGVIGAAPVY
ncbi:MULTISPECIES: hypothetical protein [unclassified Brevundimonas]|uniref:hypothetical protein n=1 Tax=unclassified Brevundimonas TaxID=2622653 RepID=UPI000CFC1111|nr:MULTISPECIES: hypothetical protein [unclassified Brevundimonas]PRA35265.1 hypothetical protein CQ024_02295 [Brevundimonas sp. MYb27]PQZ82986.1 hypothetical protein CQ026_07040 [Brevundimonas sp. MYb31]PRB14988.1 hypothetical protein CQ039_08935 [Brevundimonas sp. MYb52]PRB36909.1 hypothetical protein CQ035_04480 [Brevundimonas sp. MYb46]PRB52214.1 hypothetical protein CQ028_06590 [Brevundimonas sp. MYb33]